MFLWQGGDFDERAAMSKTWIGFLRFPALIIVGYVFGWMIGSCFDKGPQETTLAASSVVVASPRLPADLVEPSVKELKDLQPGEQCFANVTALKRRANGALFLSGVYTQLSTVDEALPYLIVRRAADGSWHVVLRGSHRYPESMFGDLPVSSFTWDRKEKR